MFSFILLKLELTGMNDSAVSILLFRIKFWNLY